MADNVAITAGSGTTVATDDVSSVHYQYVKLADGTANSSEKIGGDAANGLDVDVTRLPALAAGSNTIGNVGTLPVTSGGLSPYSFLSTAAVIAALVKAGAGQIYSLQVFNLSDAPVFVRLYDHVDAPAAGDTADIKWRGVVPGNADSDGAGFVVQFPNGLAFSTGVGIRVTAAVADNDNTSLSANVILGNVQYK